MLYVNSAKSQHLCLTYKHFVAFTDFNEDDYICENDLKRVIQRLCGEQRLSDENVNALIQKVNYCICQVNHSVVDIELHLKSGCISVECFFLFVHVCGELKFISF